jgi:predicted nucleotidyltransferase
MSATQVAPVPTLADLRARRDEILRLAAGRGARRIRVFGSVARGEAHADSDIDFVVELEPGRSLIDICDLMADLEDTLGRKVDVVEIKTPSRSAALIEYEAMEL